MENQLLDNMDLERERGITIKARAVTLDYQAEDGETYALNLIDTPGHVDFNYEVSRSLAACEGAVLVVDASQGIEAQTLANTYLALEHDLEILPVLNKIDLPAADPQRVKEEIEDIIGLPAMDAPEISAKQGINIHAVLEDIVQNVPAPTGDRGRPAEGADLRQPVRRLPGRHRLLPGHGGHAPTPGMTVKMMASGAEYQGAGVRLSARPWAWTPCDELTAGEVGYFTASIKNVKDTRVGDTITGADDPAAEPLPGYRPAQPMVYCGIYTEDGSKYPDLRDALEKLQLNDASLSFEPEILRRPGLRLPLRLSGHAPHGDHPGAAGAGVRPGPGHHPALRYLRGHQDRRHRGAGGQPPQLPRPGPHRRGPGALCQGVHHLAPRLCGQHHAHVPGPPGRCLRTCSIWTPTWWSCTTHMPLERDHLRLLRRPEGPHQGLCLAGL